MQILYVLNTSAKHQIRKMTSAKEFHTWYPCSTFMQCSRGNFGEQATVVLLGETGSKWKAGFISSNLRKEEDIINLMATKESQSEEEYNCLVEQERMQNGLVEDIESLGLKPKEEVGGLSLVESGEFEGPKSSENDSEGTNHFLATIESKFEEEQGCFEEEQPNHQNGLVKEIECSYPKSNEALTGGGQELNECEDPKSLGNDSAGTNHLLARAVYDYRSKSDVELNLDCDDIITIISKESEHWWWGEKDGFYGYVPVNHITVDCNKDEINWQNGNYFDIYGETKLHLEMLSDRPRMLAYLEAVKENVEFLQGKSVMDVGSGTGILSLFLVRDGKAGKVHSIEASNASEYAEEIIKSNGYGGKVTIHNKMVEDVVIDEKIDLIVSEWMGTLLISEFMIESVINARDMFLAQGGNMWPSSSTLYCAPCSASAAFESKLKFWDDVYGFDFSVMKKSASKELTEIPIHDHVASPEELLAAPMGIMDLDMKTVSARDLENIENTLDITVTKSGLLHGFCTWFTVEFENLIDLRKPPVLFNTGPDGPLTHWKHPLLLLDSEINVCIGDRISCVVQLKRNSAMRRHLIVNLSGDIVRSEKVIFSFKKNFKCWQ